MATIELVTLVPFDRHHRTGQNSAASPASAASAFRRERLHILASSADRHELFENYPDLEEEDLLRALAFAAATASPVGIRAMPYAEDAHCVFFESE